MMITIMRVFLCALLIACPIYGNVPGGCEGLIPDYILEGNSGMILTEEAEKLLCRDDGGLQNWDGKLLSGQSVIVENMIVLSSQVRPLTEQPSRIEFRNCIFPEELYLEGPVRSSMLFDKCEFRGNVDFHDADVAEGVSFQRSTFHQGIHVADSVFRQLLGIYGSILAGDFSIDNSQFSGGVRMVGNRFSGDLVANGLRSAGLSFEESRFLGTVSITDFGIGGDVRFRESEWSEKALISFTRGTIVGGLLFDSCGFESTWNQSRETDEVVVRLSDITISSSMVLADARSDRFPVLQVSRCLVPFIKMPEWSIAKKMVLDGSISENNRELEETGELLQLVRKSYEIQGRTRDAIAARNEQRLLIAKIKGQPSLGLRQALNYFGTGLWWLIGTIVFFSMVLFGFAERWGVADPGEGLFSRAYRVIDLSIRGFFKGPPEDGPLALRMSKMARRWLILERFFGIAFFFLLGLAMKDWLEG